MSLSTPIDFLTTELGGKLGLANFDWDPERGCTLTFDQSHVVTINYRLESRQWWFVSEVINEQDIAEQQRPALLEWLLAFNWTQSDSGHLLSFDSENRNYLLTHTIDLTVLRHVNQLYNGLMAHVDQLRVLKNLIHTDLEVNQASPEAIAEPPANLKGCASFSFA